MVGVTVVQLHAHARPFKLSDSAQRVSSCMHSPEISAPASHQLICTTRCHAQHASIFCWLPSHALHAVVWPGWFILTLSFKLRLDAALPCPALPCPALPCPALPCPALPCPALPCPALPRKGSLALQVAESLTSIIREGLSTEEGSKLIDFMHDPQRVAAYKQLQETVALLKKAHATLRKLPASAAAQPN